MSDIWIGLVDAVPIDPEGSALGGAYVHVLAPAGDRLDLLAAAGEALAEHDLRVADLDDAEPVREVLRRPIDPELVELALDSALARETRLGPFHWYPAERDTDPSALVASTVDEPRATMAAALDNRTLMKVRSRYESEGATGYVVGLGTRWALLHIVNDDVAEDGFLATSLEMVAEIEPVDPEQSFFPRVMAMRPPTASPPDVDLDDTRGLLQTAQRSFPLLTIQTEQHHPGACYIGRIASLDEDTALLHLVSPAGEWDEQDEYPYESITRVGFGGRYEEALALAAGPDPAV
ncbi:MAG: hypothetical protein QOE87_2471 [Gaiellales bacterium]|nr:hypothetical protein [Gaiellales bacterium]